MINYFRRKNLKKRLEGVFNQPSTHRRQIFCLFLVLALTGLLLGYGILWICAGTFPNYQAVLNKGEAQVYDGDTLKDVRVKIHKHKDKIPKEPVEIWTGIWLTHEGIEVETDIRIAGIDTPEKRVSTKNKDGTKRSEASRNRERAAAAAARQAVVDLLRDNHFRMTIRNPVLGKYAGRIVADVIVIDEDVAKYLIKHRHAKPYDGGTKPQWNWGK